MQTQTWLQPTREDRASEWREAELIERAELLDQELRDLRSERDEMKTELLIAHAWVAELAGWIEEGTTGTSAPRSFSLEATLNERTRARLREEENAPLPWSRMLAVAALVAIPWLVLAALTWLVWAALS